MVRIVLLVGPKGVGKTRLGTMLAEVFGAHAVPVEALWLARMRDVPRPDGERGVAWEHEGFDLVVDEVADAARTHPLVVLDTSSASRTSSGAVFITPSIARGVGPRGGEELRTSPTTLDTLASS